MKVNNLNPKKKNYQVRDGTTISAASVHQPPVFNLFANCSPSFVVVHQTENQMRTMKSNKVIQVLSSVRVFHRARKAPNTTSRRE